MAIQLAASGPRITKDAAWFAKKEQFARRHCVVFEGFVAPSLVARVPQWLETSRYVPLEHAYGGVTGTRELIMRGDQPLVCAFNLLLNQGQLFEAIAEFAGVEEELAAFEGRCYKRLPIDSHFDAWHNDASGRRLGLSISLSPKPVEGGVFTIRRARTREVLRRLPPRRLGDAHLFRIHNSLEHRVSSVRGTQPKYAFAGWFSGGVGDRAALRNALARSKRRKLGLELTGSRATTTP